MIKRKNRKRSEEIAIEIKENERIFDQHIEEAKRLLEIKERYFNQEIHKLSNNLDETKAKIIEKAGKLAEKLNLYPKTRISRELTKRFKGYMYRGYIQRCCKNIDPGWLKPYTYTGANKSKSGFSKHGNDQKPLSEGLTKQDQEYLEAHEEETKRNEAIAQLLFYITGKTLAEQGSIIRQTPKGEDFRKRLVDSSAEYMLKVTKRMIPSDISTTLWDLRTLQRVLDKWSEILYQEQEVNKKKEGLSSV